MRERIKWLTEQGGAGMLIGMNIYEFGGADMVIAEGPEDAWSIWCELTGERQEDHDGELRELPSDEEIGIWCDPNGKICEQGEENGGPVRLSAAAWVKREGRGFLCSSEF